MRAILAAERKPASTPAIATVRGSDRGRGMPRGSCATRAGAHRGGEHHVHNEATRATSRERRRGRAGRRGGHAEAPAYTDMVGMISSW